MVRSGRSERLSPLGERDGVKGYQPRFRVSSALWIVSNCSMVL